MSSRAIFIIAAIVAVTGTAEAADDQVLFKSDFESAHVDSLPEELMVLAGEFSVKDIGGNKATHSKTLVRSSDLRNPTASPCGRAFIPKAPDGSHPASVLAWTASPVTGFSSRPAKIGCNFSRTKRRSPLPRSNGSRAHGHGCIFRFARCRRANGSSKDAHGRMGSRSQTSGQYPLKLPRHRRRVRPQSGAPPIQASPFSSTISASSRFVLRIRATAGKEAHFLSKEEFNPPDCLLR